MLVCYGKMRNVGSSEAMPVNHRVRGSSPCWGAKHNRGLEIIVSNPLLLYPPPYPPTNVSIQVTPGKSDRQKTLLCIGLGIFPLLRGRLIRSTQSTPDHDQTWCPTYFPSVNQDTSCPWSWNLSDPALDIEPIFRRAPRFFKSKRPFGAWRGRDIPWSWSVVWCPGY